MCFPIFAIDVIVGRLQRDYEGVPIGQYVIRPEPASEDDAHALAEEDKHAFQDWALRKLGAAHAVHKKGADKGVDGRMYYFEEIAGNDPKLIVVSVKGGKTGSGDVRNLVGAMAREKAALGVFVCRRKPTPAMQTEAAEVGSYLAPDRMIPKLQIVTVEDLFKDGPKIDLPFEAVAMPVSPDLIEPSLLGEHQEARRFE